VVVELERLDAGHGQSEKIVGRAVGREGLQASAVAAKGLNVRVSPAAGSAGAGIVDDERDVAGERVEIELQLLAVG
jgi:hypothetical protein